MYLRVIALYALVLRKTDELSEDILLQEVFLEGLPVFVFGKLLAVLVRIGIRELIGVGEVHAAVIPRGVEGGVPSYEDIRHDPSAAADDPSAFGAVGRGVGEMDGVGGVELPVLEPLHEVLS